MNPLNELSLNVLDIAFNSVKAGASYIRISVNINIGYNLLKITVWDNGCGFDAEEYEKNMASDTEKKGGNGLPLFKESAEKTGGSFYIVSKPGEGTAVSASYTLNSPNRAVLGDMEGTIAALSLCEGIRIVYTYTIDNAGFSLDTAEISGALGVPLTDCPEGIKFIKDFIRENTDLLNKNRIF